MPNISSDRHLIEDEPNVQIQFALAKKATEGDKNAENLLWQRYGSAWNRMARFNPHGKYQPADTPQELVHKISIRARKEEIKDAALLKKIYQDPEFKAVMQMLETSRKTKEVVGTSPEDRELTKTME